jgi:hypothetical protein
LSVFMPRLRVHRTARESGLALRIPGSGAWE